MNTDLGTIVTASTTITTGYNASYACKSFLETKEAEKNKLTELELGLENNNSNNSNQINQDNNLI